MTCADVISYSGSISACVPRLALSCFTGVNGPLQTTEKPMKTQYIALEACNDAKHFSKFMVFICRFSRLSLAGLIERNRAIIVFWIMPAHGACQFSRNEVGNGKSLFFYWRKHLHRTWFVSWKSRKIGWRVCFSEKQNTISYTTELQGEHSRGVERDMIQGALSSWEWSGQVSAVLSVPVRRTVIGRLLWKSWQRVWAAKDRQLW